MSFQWPVGFARCPAEDWALKPLEELALKYDTVEEHGWYDNLDTSVEQLAADLQPGDILIDYSGGTGILSDRLFAAIDRDDFGMLIVDSSPKFLRLALEKFKANAQVGFGLIRYLKPERRLQLLNEVIGAQMAERGVDALCSTNAIHLYYGLSETLGAWHDVLRPGGRVYVQSGNMRNPNAKPGTWIIDETVAHIHKAAMELVRTDSQWSQYATVLEDAEYMAAHDVLRDKYFLPVRPVQTYVDALTESGFEVIDEIAKVIPARVDEWYSFLSVYHEGVLGWVGGAERVTGSPASPDVTEDRKRLIRMAMDVIFDGKDTFEASWTYIRARKPS